MTGDSDTLENEYTSDDIPIHSGDEEETPACCNLFFILFLGLGIAITIVVLFLGFLVLGNYALIPIEHWAEGFDIVILILVEIPLVSVFVLYCLIGSYIIGCINRFGVERISKIDLPHNRKWIILHGFIVTLTGLILVSIFFGFTMMIEPPESYWIGLASYTIIHAIEWFCFVLVGLVGYLVAVKLPVFRDKPHDEVVDSSRTS